MTGDERERFNSLCLQIQMEKDYRTFERLLTELNSIIDGKHRRFKEFRPLASSSAKARAWKTVRGSVRKLLKPTYQAEPERVEISVPEADYLFREIRIANDFTAPDGERVGLSVGTQLDITFEADRRETLQQQVSPD